MLHVVSIDRRNPSSTRIQLADGAEMKRLAVVERAPGEYLETLQLGDLIVPGEGQVLCTPRRHKQLVPIPGVDFDIPLALAGGDHAGA